MRTRLGCSSTGADAGARAVGGATEGADKGGTADMARFAIGGVGSVAAYLMKLASNVTARFSGALRMMPASSKMVVASFMKLVSSPAKNA